MPAELSIQEANDLYDLLVEHAGATEGWRSDFVFHQAKGETTEYRFQGALGFGGKFYRDVVPNGERWSVDFYKEDHTPQRQAMKEAVNPLLQAMCDRVLGGRTSD